MFSPMGPFMTELYPTAVRGVGQGFCYNVGRGIGALFPALVGFLAAEVGLTTAIAILQPERLRSDDRGAVAVAGDPGPIADQP